MRALAAVIALTLLAAPAAAETRIALVVGNEDYPAEVGALSHPYEDAQAIADALRTVGFELVTGDVVRDAEQSSLVAAILAFQEALAEAGPDGVGFFYYSGHGGSAETQGRRRNYLIPAHSPITRADQLPFLGVELSGVIDSLAATKAKAVFVVSDACRNTLPWTSDRGGAQPDRGFVVEADRAGLFIAHATAEGETAPDDGVFARELAAQLTTPNVYAPRAFSLAFRQVASTRDVYRRPVVSDQLDADICFNGCPGDPTPPTPAAARPDNAAQPTSEEIVREAQELLAAMDYDPGPVNGAAGNQTRAAVQRFRAAAGLGSGDEIDAGLVATLHFFRDEGHAAPSAQAPKIDVAPAVTAELGGGERIALVIGNADYQQPGWSLATPANDASLVASSLEALGFAVDLVFDGDRDVMSAAIRSFATRLSGAGPDAVGVFYFAGHAVGSEGVNYLIPVDADVNVDSDVWARGVRLDLLMDHIGRAGSATNFVFLDASRANPLSSSGSQTALSQVDHQIGVLVALASSPGVVAADRPGDHSVFSQALAHSLTTPGVPAESMLRDVQMQVINDTDRTQSPWYSSGLVGGDFCFAGCEAR